MPNLPAVIFSKSRPGVEECACHRERRLTIQWSITRRSGDGLGYEGLGSVALCQQGLEEMLETLYATDDPKELLRKEAEALGAEVPPKASLGEIRAILERAQAAKLREARAAEEAEAERQEAARREAARESREAPDTNESETQRRHQPPPDEKQLAEDLPRWKLMELSRADLVKKAGEEPWGIIGIAEGVTKAQIVERMAEITPYLAQS